ncbi:MAG: putative ABC transporter arginine-binding protein ArtJ [Chlamydiae bacterium]|nr:putative ABC transporter arginine-binding protein ArtJ [Chlamydiota bacterium]
MKYLILFLFIICALVGLSQLIPKHDDEKELIVGTNAEYPPYTFIENGKITGFDIDVANLICQKLEKEMLLVDMPFDALLPQLQMNQIDFIAAGITKTEERAKKVLFTKPYLTGDPLVIVSRVPVDLTKLKSLTIVVNEGYHADVYASSIDGLEMIRLPAPADALFALQSQRADGFITALSTAKNLGKDYFISEPLGDASDPVSLAISNKHPELLSEIEVALEEMIFDGSLDELKKKWGFQ